jgi:uncharacterized protein
MNLNCQTCGACCKGLPVWLDDMEVGHFTSKKTLAKLVVLQSDAFYMRQTKSGRCIALKGRIGKSCSCSIYQERPLTCREFEPGSPDCLEAREKYAISS